MPLTAVEEIPVTGTAAWADWGVATAVCELGVWDVVEACGQQTLSAWLSAWPPRVLNSACGHHTGKDRGPG